MDGAASVIPATCVNMIPKAIASGVRTPNAQDYKLSRPSSLINQDRPTVALIFEGEISVRYIGAAHMPIPDATPIKNLRRFF